MSVASTLVSRQSDPAHSQRLVQELQQLLTDDGLAIALDRVNRKKFFLNFSSFLMAVRGFLLHR